VSESNQDRERNERRGRRRGEKEEEKKRGEMRVLTVSAFTTTQSIGFVAPSTLAVPRHYPPSERWAGATNVDSS